MKPGSISASDVSRCFRISPEPNLTLKQAILRRRGLRRTEVWAVRDVSFEIEPGEAVGLIGRNGSGKTTMLRLIAGIFKPTSGRLHVDGSIASLLELGAGFNPEFTGRENVYMNAAIHGLKRRYVRERMDEIVDFAELDDFIDVPVRTYSSGMYMRLGFAVATHLTPDVLLLDEVFAVGDEAFQRKSFRKVLDLKRDGRTIVFVSHAAPAVERLCDRGILLREGSLLYDGGAHEAIAKYHKLLAAEEAPAERAAGLREWGSGEVRAEAIRVEGPEGDERTQFLSGAPFVVRFTLRASELVPPPRVTLEFRDANGALLGTSEADLVELGWTVDRPSELEFELPRLPLADGRFQISIAVTDASGRRNYHRIDPAVDFAVHRDETARGWFRFDGEWSLTEAAAPVKTA